jgi:hypothetical protein
MEILRVPPYPINTTWDVPNANTAYTVVVEDVVDHSLETSTITSDVNSQITYTLPRSKVQFDRDFAFRVYDSTGEIVVDSNLTVYRPYVDPNLLGTTPSEVAEYKKWEIVARAIIDAYLQNDSATGEGFYNHKLVVNGVGTGTDYYPMWHNPKRVLQVYENNLLVFNGEDVALTLSNESNTGSYVTFTTSAQHNYAIGDTVIISGVSPDSYNGTYTVTDVPTSTSFTYANTSTSSVTVYGTSLRYWENKFVIAQGNSALMRLETGLYNRLEQKPPVLPLAYGDVGPYGMSYGGSPAFPAGSDYVFILDVGYKAVPPDVEWAATELIQDLKCDRNPYYKRFVTQYDTDQFNIKYAPAFLGGTGNNIVDKILDGYKGNVIKPGIL